MKTEPRPSQTTKPTQSNTFLPVYPLPDQKTGWHLMLILALGLTLLYFVTALPIRQSDPAARSAYALTAAMATERTASIDRAVQSASGTFLLSPADFPNAAYYQGHYYSDAAPGTSFFALPFYQVGRLTADLFTALSPASNAASEAPAAFSLLAMALAGAGAVLLVYACALRLGSTEISARYGALTFGLASALWYEAGHFGPGALSLLLLSAALFLALPPLPRQQQHQTEQYRLSWPRALLLGLLLGLAVCVDYPNIIWTPLFVIYLFWSGRLSLRYKRTQRLAASNQPPAISHTPQPVSTIHYPLSTSLLSSILLLVAFLLGLLPLALYNQAIFNRPWAFTYGFLLANPEAQSLAGQFLGGFTLDNLRQAFFGEGRAVLGPFLVFLGLWGLVALYIQRGKRKEASLLFSLIALSFLLGLLRRPVGQGPLRVDFIVGVMPPLALGVAIWQQRFQFLTRMEQSWVPRLAFWGVALYYLVAYPGPLFNNFGNLIYLLPLALLIVVMGLLWWVSSRRIFAGKRRVALVATLISLFILQGFILAPASNYATAFSGNYSNILLYNSELKCDGTKLPGWYFSESCQPALPVNGIRVSPNAQLQPYLIGVQGGKSYVLTVERETTNLTNLEVTWQWSDEGHQPLPGQFTYSWKRMLGSVVLTDRRAAPPGAAYLQLSLHQGDSPAVFYTVALVDESVRLEPLKNYARAALSFSFDWESAMGGLIHSKGGASLAAGEGESGGPALDESNRQKAVQNAEERGMDMRNGANNLLQMFQKYGIVGTFYATGYNLLDGNPDHVSFAANPTYKWANPANLWANDYWTKHPWYGDDPYGTYQTNPAWYFGDQTDALRQAGQDIQSHTFGHLYVRGTSPAEFGLDMATWVKYATDKGLTARSFAFPWKSSNSVKDEHYKILADLGFRSVTRLYDGDQGVQYDKDGHGTLIYDNGKRTANNQRIYEAAPGPENFYYYLDRVKYDPRLLVLHDFQLTPLDQSEAQAKTLVDELLIRRGYGSIWTHPEAVVDPRDKDQWEHVISYAASKRDSGLWVDSVTNLVQQRLDIQKVGVETGYSDNNRRLTVTLTNQNSHAVDGLTLTLPAQVNRVTQLDGSEYKNFKGAQLVAPKLAANQTLTLIVYLNK